MWWLALIAVGVIGWALSDDEDDPAAKESTVAVLRDDRLAEDEQVDLPVVWAEVPFTDDPTQSKIRPVLVIDCTDDNFSALPMYSKPGRTTEHQAWVELSPESTATFDKKAAPSWVKISPPIVLPWTALPYPTREPGSLTSRDLRRLEAIMSEYRI